MTTELVRDVLAAEQARLRAALGDAAWSAAHYPLAGRLLDEITTSPTFASFLTLAAYRELP